jgi:hypothetical protein
MRGGARLSRPLYAIPEVRGFYSRFDRSEAKRDCSNSVSEPAWNGQPGDRAARRQAVLVDGSPDDSTVVAINPGWTVALAAIVDPVPHDRQEPRPCIVAVHHAEAFEWARSHTCQTAAAGLICPLELQELLAGSGGCASSALRPAGEKHEALSRRAERLSTVGQCDDWRSLSGSMHSLRLPTRARPK